METVHSWQSHNQAGATNPKVRDQKIENRIGKVLELGKIDKIGGNDNLKSVAVSLP